MIQQRLVIQVSLETLQDKKYAYLWLDAEDNISFFLFFSRFAILI